MGRVQRCSRPMSMRGLVALGFVALSSFGCAEISKKISNPNGDEEAMRSAQQQAAQLQQQAGVKSAEDRRAFDASEAKRAQEKAAAEKAIADQKERERRELEESCASTRAERLAYLKQTIKDYYAEVKELQPHYKWITAHCKYEDTRGVLVQRERTKDGVIIRTKAVGEEDALTCDAPKPAGVTQERVKRTLWLESREQTDPIGLNYATNRNQFGTVNSRCAAADKAAGVDFYVTMTDVEGHKAILAK